MLERLLVQRACLQSIGFLLESIQLPLLYKSGNPMLVRFSIAPKLGQLPPLALEPVVEVSELVALVLELVPVRVWNLLAEFLAVLLLALVLVLVLVAVFELVALEPVVVFALSVLVLILSD
jgi:hypothetical protein